MAAPRAYILGCAGPDLTDAEHRFFAEADPWGFILFARNVDTPDRLRRLTADLRQAVGRAAPILIDQEGGRVQRLTPPHWRAWLPPLDQVTAAGPGGAERSMYLRGRLIAAELHAVGIDVNCAPMADIADDETHPFLRNRCYGTTVASVLSAARAMAGGLLDGGVLPVVKHIPGHGRGRVDSHLALPVVAASRDELERDFAPFRGLADLPLGMTAHVVYRALDDRPATQSPPVISLIRDRIGFDGLLMTDDISMQALNGDVVDRGRAALAAGCDLILHCNGDPREMAALAGAVGPLSASAQDRAERALARRGPPVPIDIAAAEAELGALLKGQGNG